MSVPSRLSPIPEEIIDAFRAIAPTIESFARDQDLSIERYRRGKAAWELSLEPPRGGRASLTISYRERTGHLVDVSAVWWVDDPESRTRRLHADKIGAWERRASSQALRAMLEDGLRRIKAWTENDLGPPRGPYPVGSQENGNRSGSA